jgi:hypothetical protein
MSLVLPNPWLILGGVAVVIGAAGAGYYYGHKNEKAAYDLYVSTQAKKADGQVIANKTALAKQTADLTAQMTQIKKDSKDAIKSISDQRDVANANSDQYAAKLRYYLAHPSVRTVVVPGAPAAASGSDGSGAGGLPDGVSDLNRYLVDRFYAADVNTTHLIAAQQIIEADRKVCNGSLPGITGAAAQ